MRTALKLGLLALGFCIIVYFGTVLIRLADAMRDAGRSPWSWDFVGPNLLQLSILPMLGLSMMVAGFVMLVRDGR